MVADLNTTLIREHYRQAIEENMEVLQHIDMDTVSAVVPLISEAKAVYVAGAGRSGIMLKAAAMRFMHAGLQTYVVGETTTPAIQPGDVLLVASGSGTTQSVVSMGQKAKKAGATVILITIAEESPLAALADHRILVPAAKKQDHGGTFSKQYAGSLFEQSVLFITEAIFQTIWHQSGVTAEVLWQKHANLE